jgi:hypothetical protein
MNNDFFSEIEPFDYKGHELAATCVSPASHQITGPEASPARVSHPIWTGTMDGHQLCAWPWDPQEKQGRRKIPISHRSGNRAAGKSRTVSEESSDVGR